MANGKKTFNQTPSECQRSQMETFNSSISLKELYARLRLPIVYIYILPTSQGMLMMANGERTGSDEVLPLLLPLSLCFIRWISKIWAAHEGHRRREVDMIFCVEENQREFWNLQGSALTIFEAPMFRSVGDSHRCDIVLKSCALSRFDKVFTENQLIFPPALKWHPSPLSCWLWCWWFSSLIPPTVGNEPQCTRRSPERVGHRLRYWNSVDAKIPTSRAAFSDPVSFSLGIPPSFRAHYDARVSWIGHRYGLGVSWRSSVVPLERALQRSTGTLLTREGKGKRRKEAKNRLRTNFDVVALVW